MIAMFTNENKENLKENEKICQNLQNLVGSKQYLIVKSKLDQILNKWGNLQTSFPRISDNLNATEWSLGVQTTEDLL